MLVFAFILGPKEIGSDKESPNTILQNLRLKNVDKIIIGHINITIVLGTKLIFLLIW